ncbi:hypothetical protein ACE6H2_004927 [Prunus campanulata]
MSSSDLQLPPGFRFHPTDEELVKHYLCRKCQSQSISVPIIAEIDLYKYNPWDLPAPTRPNDYVYFDTSDSVPRLHTDSSCSEHVVSPEFTCEVQSEPRWKEWEKALDFNYNYMDTSVENGFGAQFQTVNQMSPLQDIFMYLQKPY